MNLPDSSVTGAVEGALANIDGQGRLAIPIHLLRAVCWWRDVSRDVLAELHRPGLVRIFAADGIGSTLAGHHAEHDGGDLERVLEFEQVLADRYRILKLYGDGRLTVTREVAELLDVDPGQPDRLFAQSFDAGLSLMSLAFRRDRLANHGQFPPIALERLQALK
jgi:hypothetical protein